MRRIGLVVLLGSLMVFTVASTTVWADDAPKASVRGGGDERIRQETFDNIPIRSGGFTRGGENDYFRFRTRVWAEVDPITNVTARVRMANEFRLWVKPDNYPSAQKSNYSFPDEYVFDNLYLDVRNLADNRLDLRVGRQDLSYGTGMVIMDGTPKDGSRTFYCNAAKLTWKGVQDTTIDFLGIYNDPDDPWAINSAGRELTGYLSGDDMVESGGGVYVKNKTVKTFPVEGYLLYKNESSWEQAAKTNSTGGFVAPKYAWQELNTERKVIETPALDLGTLGVRLLPEFSETLKGTLETAFQYGERGDTEAMGYGIDAFLDQNLPILETMKPVLEYGVYYLSGDDPNTDKDERWNPLWGRFPQRSELYVFAYDAEGAGDWGNLDMPRASLSISPTKKVKLTGGAAYLLAPEADGPGDGHRRGALGQFRIDFTFAEKVLTAKDKFTGYFLVEALDPGNYYDEDETAYFARWQLAYDF